MAANRTSSNYHACECYGHDQTIPDYKHDVSVPRTLQGYYAKSGGCPCPAKTHGAGATNPGCVCGTNTALAKSTYRAADGPHPVHPAAPGNPSDLPNSKNYGGTVAQRGHTTLESTAQPRGAATKRRAAEKTEEKLQDRKNFLKAVLRDEMLARMDAETKRDALEQGTGLMGSYRAAEYEATGTLGAAGDNTATATTRGPGNLPTPADQYEEVMDELRYVAAQPVGSKYNINRLYYLLEEEDRISNLRREEKMAARSRKM